MFGAAVILATISAISIGSPSLRTEPPDEREMFPIFSPQNVESAIDVTISNFRCDDFLTCSAGPKYVESGSGIDVDGCYLNGTATCAGDCAWCTGAANPGSFCKKVTGASCHYFSTPESLVKCGKNATRSCQYSTTPLGGQFPTTNSCYCAGGVTTPDGQCYATQCVSVMADGAAR